MNDIRREMPTRARPSYGLLNVSKDDVDCINIVYLSRRGKNISLYEN